MDPKTLTQADIQLAATTINCDVNAIRAVLDVESRGSGFNPDGSPKTLFEGHKFYAYTRGAYAKSNPTICYRVWTTAYYGKSWEAEQRRLQQAMSLDREAALKSASRGMFQIMGANYGACGFASVQDFVNAMYKSEGAQLQAFVGFVLHEKLDDELREQRWADFARRYNGPEYARNAYDKKLKEAFNKHANWK